MSLQGIDQTAQDDADSEIRFPDLLWAVAVAVGLMPVAGFYLLFLS